MVRLLRNEYRRTVFGSQDYAGVVDRLVVLVDSVSTDRRAVGSEQHTQLSTSGPDEIVQDVVSLLGCFLEVVTLRQARQMQDVIVYEEILECEFTGSTHGLLEILAVKVGPLITVE